MDLVSEDLKTVLGLHFTNILSTVYSTLFSFTAQSTTVTEPANYTYHTRGPIKGFISILSLAMWDILLMTK